MNQSILIFDARTNRKYGPVFACEFLTFDQQFWFPAYFVGFSTMPHTQLVAVVALR